MKLEKAVKKGVAYLLKFTATKNRKHSAYLQECIYLKWVYSACSCPCLDFELTKIILLPKLFWPTVRKKNSCDREKLLKIEAEGLEFENFLRWLEQFIQTVKGQNNFWQQNAFLTYSWRFLISNKLEQL